MNDEGEFTLIEPYATMLKEAKIAGTKGWATGVITYLGDRVSYTYQELLDALLYHNKKMIENGSDPEEALESFVLEALSGDLQWK